jgi:flagellar hook-associated protein 1 FlgK
VPQVSPDGLRLAASNTSFTLSARLNGSETAAEFSVNTNALIDVSLASISETLVSDLRSTAGLPSLTGAALSTLPSEGSRVSVLVGASQYDVEYVSGEFVVNGPEAGRVFAEIQAGDDGNDYFSINVADGILNGTSLQLLDGGDLTEFGLASTETTAVVDLKGSSFSGLDELADGDTKTFDMMVGETETQISVSRSGDDLSISSNNSSVTASIKTVANAHNITLEMAYYDNAEVEQGPMRIKPSTNAAAFGFRAADFSVELTETGFKTVSVNGNPSGVTLDVENLPGQVLSMSGLPNEDFIVLLESEGAKRLASSFEMSTEEDAKAQKDYRVKVVDADAGRVELIDVETGTSMATRFTNGVVEFEADNYRFELAGFGSTDDHFDIALNRSNAGDARNMIAMIALSRSTAERSSFQDDFRQIALAVGSQLESGRLLNISATAIRDAAIATEDELAGVNLDEEAGKLMEQQQAYKAAAQILQTARDLFDTIISIM